MRDFFTCGVCEVSLRCCEVFTSITHYLTEFKLGKHSIAFMWFICEAFAMRGVWCNNLSSQTTQQRLLDEVEDELLDIGVDPDSTTNETRWLTEFTMQSKL